MAVLDDEIDTGLSLAEGGAGVWSPLRAASRRQSQDLRAQYERERARAKAAEARCEELRQAGMEARSRAGLLKWQLNKCQAKLKAAGEETKEVRRTAKNALSLQAEVDPSRKSGGALHRLHCFCLEFDRAFEVQRRVPTDGIIEPIDVSGYGSFSLAS